MLRGHFPCDLDGAVRTLQGIGQHEFNSQGFKDRQTFGAGIGRDGQGHPHSEWDPQSRISDTHVPGGRIEQAPASRQLSCGEGGANDVQRRAVFDRAAGVEPLGLG